MKDIKPGDAQQGALGNCYFISSLSTIAQRPQLIDRIFHTKTYQRDGLYGLWLCIDGIWQLIKVDNFFVTNYGKTVFSTFTSDKNFWVLLLEKAYAKVNRCYANLASGLPHAVFRDLTNAPSAHMDVKL